MAKWTTVATGLVAAGLVASAGVGLVAARQAPGDRAGGGAPQAPANRGVGELAEPTDHIEVAPRSTATSAQEPANVLAARLGVLQEVLGEQEHLFRTGQLTQSQLNRTRGEVAILTAQLEFVRDNLRDELERLLAERDVKMADRDGAVALLEKAKGRQAGVDKLAKNLVVSKGELEAASHEVAYENSRRNAKEAEVREVDLRIAQVRRRLLAAESLVKSLVKTPSAAPKPIDPSRPPAPPAAPVAATEDWPGRDLKAIQGTWATVSFESDGKKFPVVERDDERLVIRGDRWTVRNFNGKDYEGTIRLDPSRQPRAEDVTITKGPVGEVGSTLRGIYLVDGDTYMECWADQGERPTEFMTSPGSHRTLVIYRRARP